MIIAVAGGSGSGKTTVSRAMKHSYSQRFDINVEVVSMDDYYKNENEERFDNYDHPDAFDTDLLYGDIQEFLDTGSIVKRSYDYVTKKSSIIHDRSNVKLLIIEGLYAFYEKKIRDMCSLKVYLDTEEEIRLQRRILRDLRERSITVEENMKMIKRFVRQMHGRYVERQKRLADRVFVDSEEVLMLL
ncbi:uridine kinase family protein [Sulfurovum sp. ST-21]|uniref:phosphoribulokinase n=1 Tax=Sulfurovum indicum TaxID=2779528 RepID=A0A7M1S4F2_9BACT|nr:AAA family ATPase [Sulfurovum indicum]QOR61962.1 AAA family ATPase [Sulfurovum indicum]